MMEERQVSITKEGEINKPNEPIDTFYTSAARCKGNMTHQEQAILQEIAGICESSKKGKKIKWVDICCGRRAILNHAVEYLQEDHKRVIYHAFDGERQFIEELKKNSKSGKIKIQCKFFEEGDVEYLEQLARQKHRYDFIVIENALHEISPDKFPDLFLNTLKMCSKKGSLFIIDMQEFPVPECNAIVWSRDDIEDIITPLFASKANVPKVRVIPARDRRGIAIPLFCVKLLRSGIKGNAIDKKGGREQTRKEIKNKISRILQKKKRSLEEEIDRFIDKHKKVDPVRKVTQIRIPVDERFPLIILYEQYRSVNRALAIP